MFPDTDGIAGELQGFILRNGEAEPIRNTFGNRCPAIAIKCRGKIEKLTAAQGTEAGVQMVETTVDKLKRNNFSVKMLTEDREDPDVRSLSISTEPIVREAQEIACPLKI